MGRIKRLSVLCVLSLFMLSGSCMADLCEFATVEEAKDFGWELLREKSIMKVVTDSMEGGYALKVAGQDEMGLYGGIRIRFPKSLNLAGVKPEDKISFYIKQDFTTGFVININGGGYYRDFRLKRNEWTKVEL
ncbi:MAG: hypothetical protein JW957_06220, partial [Candidatus Omnitrophica bacterium]|nr:hypothetical protein [Candidatus Omnitrophota bacterium]